MGLFQVKDRYKLCKEEIRSLKWQPGVGMFLTNDMPVTEDHRTHATWLRFSVCRTVRGSDTLLAFPLSHSFPPGSCRPPPPQVCEQSAQDSTPDVLSRHPVSVKATPLTPDSQNRNTPKCVVTLRANFTSIAFLILWKVS